MIRATFTTLPLRYLGAAIFDRLRTVWMDLHLFRLSLRPTLDLFSLQNEAGQDFTREQWLRTFFGRERRFLHYAKEFVFFPETKIEGERAVNLIFGWIARETAQSERTPPSDGLEPTQHIGWQAAFITIDPTEHEDGQKIAIEDLKPIGSPAAVMWSLVREMNSISNTPFLADAFPIIEEGSFWRFAENHGELIKSITFDVSAPNMFDDANDFQREMSSLRDRVNVSRVKATLESDTALNHTTEGLRQIVDYTEKGAGSLTARAVDGELYHSGANIKKVEIKVEHHSRGFTEFLRQIPLWLDRIF